MIVHHSLYKYIDRYCVFKALFVVDISLALRYIEESVKRNKCYAFLYPFGFEYHLSGISKLFAYTRTVYK